MMEGWKGYESEVDVVRHVVQFLGFYLQLSKQSKLARKIAAMALTERISTEL